MQDTMYTNPSTLERQKAHLQETSISHNFSIIENFFTLQSDHQGLGDAWPIHMRQEELATPTSTTTTISNSTSSNGDGKVKPSSNSKKRKANKSLMVTSDEEEKRMKADQGDKKLDYIHVRARRGQATDSHSLAERVRREKISERMNYLQGLVPGCDKITGKAGMLDEIINYVQSLQRQVEFLSMKLATVNPRPDFNMEALFTKEMNLPVNIMSSIGMSSEITDPSFLQFTSLYQAAPDPLLDSCFNVQRTNPSWENELNNLYNAAFSFHSLQGNVLPSNLKTEM